MQNSTTFYLLFAVPYRTHDDHLSSSTPSFPALSPIRSVLGSFFRRSDTPERCIGEQRAFLIRKIWCNIYGNLFEGAIFFRRKICPIYSHLRDRTCLTVLKAGDLASSWIVLQVICESFFELISFTFLLIWSVNIHVSEPYAIVDTTIVLYRLVLTAVGSFCSSRWPLNALQTMLIRC